MTRVTIDGESYACPFAGLLRPHTPGERVKMLASIRRHGIKAHVFHYLSPLHGRALLDGIHRATYGLELDVEVPTFFLGSMPDAVAKELALSLNLDRRQLTPEEEQAARRERVRRVVRAVEAVGVRGTAREEGVSHTQILRDIEVASRNGTGVPRRKPSLTVRAVRSANTLLKRVKDVVDSPNHRERLSAVASSYGCPLDGRAWPALLTLVAVLRDVAGGGASA